MTASNQTFIVAAYAVTWIVFSGYLLRLLRAERRARTALDGARSVAAAGTAP